MIARSVLTPYRSTAAGTMVNGHTEARAAFAAAVFGGTDRVTACAVSRPDGLRTKSQRLFLMPLSFTASKNEVEQHGVDVFNAIVAAAATAPIGAYVAPTLTLAEQAAALMNSAGLAITSTSDSALDATPATDADSQTHINAEGTSILLNGTFADGSSSIAWLDAAAVRTPSRWRSSRRARQRRPSSCPGVWGA